MATLYFSLDSYRVPFLVRGYPLQMQYKDTIMVEA